MSQVSIIDIEGSHPQIPTEFIADIGSAIPIANQLEILGTTVAAGILPVYTSASGNTLIVNVQRSQAIASTNPLNVGLAAFNSSEFSVDANGFVSLIGGGLAIDSIATQTGTSPITPTVAGLVTINGAVVVAGTNPVRSHGTGTSTMALEIQISQALAAADATKIGLSNFNSAQFSVDANGFVSATGAIPIQFTGNTGTASPSAGNINILAATTAAGTSPATTSATGSTVTVNIQKSQAIAAADTTKIGLCNFDSASFAVDSTGFVTLSTTGAGKTITGDTGGALPPTANNWNILGGPGVTTSGSGSTLTINSVVFTDTTATTLAVDNGYFATAAGTYNLPATAAQGEMIIVICDTAGAVVIDAPTSNFIRLGNQITASSGNITSSAIGDSVTLRYRLSTLTWYAVGVTGNWTIN